ncbi:trypsin-7-like [Diabrotica undecimpunctata]|uniref:trypsin-7-like n=1 Tax=Diabrotica undecimpunctata TaxID=50387 RepID=UPI003B631D8D
MGTQLWNIVFLVFIFLAKNSPVEAGSVFLGNSLRIIGGHKAYIEDHPWIVSIRGNFKRHKCGGSLLNEDTVVTAAHCLKHWNLRVVVGVSDFSSGVKSAIKIKNYTIHEKFNQETFNGDYDIAIVKLAKKVEFSDKIQPIPLLEQDAKVPTGTVVTAAGWGENEEGKELDYLLEASMKIVDQQTCKNLLNEDHISVTDRMICAGDIEEKKSACHGDSGGPLVHNGTLIGVVSWGDGGCRKYVAAYTDVGYFSTWIKKEAGL